MVALLVLATFIAMIAVDYFLHREKYDFPVNGVVTLPGVPKAAGVTLPEDLSYHPGHTWAARQADGRIRVGVDEFAAALLGHIDHVDLPKRGRWLQQGDRGWTVYTDHGPVSLAAAAEGEVIAVNERALENPELIVADPYNSGWLIELRSPEAELSFRNLLSGRLALRWMEDSVENLRRTAGATVKGLDRKNAPLPVYLGSQLQEDVWTNLTSQFFRC